MKVKEVAKVFLINARDFTVKNLPTILSCAGVVMSVGAAVLAAKETPKVMEKMEEKKNGKLYNRDGNKISDPERYDNSLSFWEKLSVAIPVYWPAALSEAAAIACIFGANKVNLQRQAALIAAYTLSENNFKEYKEKVKEIAGPKKTEKIEEQVKTDRMMQQYSEDAIIVTGYGNTLFYESGCGRYFKSSIAEVTNAILNVNKHMMANDVPLNDLYSELHIPTTSLGELFEFPGAENAELLSTDLPVSKNDSGEPCLMIWIDTDDMERSI